ncbi:hypothetical protein LSAT2_016459, partial [Lamellibrachia satsuma]
MFDWMHIEMVALKTPRTGCKGVVEYMHWCKPILRRQGQPTPSCQQPMSSAERELTKSQRMQNVCQSLKIGVTREKTYPSNRAGTRGVSTGLRAFSAPGIIHD